MKTDPTTRSGRIRLHLACLRRGGPTLWHFRGILREISEAMTPRIPHAARS